MDEAELIRKSLKGEREAFDQLASHYREKVFQHCLGLLKDESAADDVTQEALVSAYQHLDHFHQNSSFYTWLWRIAHNYCLNHLKKKKRENEIEFQDIYQTQPVATVDASLFKDYLHLLTSKQRKIFEMYYIQEMSQKEIAERLQIPYGTVRSRIYYIKKKLGKLIQ